MKKIFLLFNWVNFFLLTPYFLSAQPAVLYNDGATITVDAGAVIYVDGDIRNKLSGLIHNAGDIYLTGDWENDEPSGCLDPNTGTVILDGTTQVIKGTQPTTFNNLTCQNGSTKTLNINTIVGGTSGVLSLNSSAFVLNSKTLIVTNPLPSAITRATGSIISETDHTTGYGTIEWRIGNSSAGNNYTYPFGTISGTYIPFDFNIITAGVQSTTGSISVATYPTLTTNNPNNRPLPTGVTNLSDPSNGSEAAPLCADRFWITTPNNYTTAPVANLSFSYTDAEWDNSGGSTNTITEDSLKAWRWSGSQWLNPPAGTDIPTSNKVTVPSVNTFSIWTLKGAPPCAVSASVTATPTATITLGDSVQLTASGGVIYSWSTGATTSSIFVSPTVTTVYCAAVTDTMVGCTDTACVYIKVELPCGDLFLPNAFSPNGDGKNDKFRLRSNCIATLSFQIYDRWGNLVYSTDNPLDAGWDGSTPKGKPANDGVYAYHIVYTTSKNNTPVELKGTVTLLR
jgi:gliding motility-associated-like protein